MSSPKDPEYAKAIAAVAFFVNNGIVTLNHAVSDLLKKVALEVSLSAHWDPLEIERLCSVINRVKRALVWRHL